MLAGFAGSSDGRDDLPQFLRRFLPRCVRVFALGCGEQVRVDAKRYLRALAIPQLGKAWQAQLRSASAAFGFFLRRFGALILVFVFIVRHLSLDQFLAGNRAIEMLGDIGVVATTIITGGVRSCPASRLQ